MRAKNLDDSHGMQVQEWADVAAQLDRGMKPEQDSGALGRITTWLATINPDGSPHVTAVGAIWMDGTFWFQTGNVTRKARNIARDARCSISVSMRDFDLVLEGAAVQVTDRADIERAAARWASHGWPCDIDESATGLTAPFNAPGQGPPPWPVYRITPRSATSCSNVEPGGTTRWTF
jgi:hypothetical protein